MVTTASGISSRGTIVRTGLSDIEEFTVTVLEEMVEPEFPACAVLEILRPALNGEIASFQRTALPSGATVNITPGYGPEIAAAFVDRSRTRWSEHPTMAAAARGERAPATCQRAAGGERIWKRHAVRNFLVELGGWEQIASVPLVAGPTEVCGLAFARSGSDFTAADLDLLAAVQRPLQVIERHARVMARWMEALGASVDAARADVRDAGLTARQLDVLVLLAEGHTAASIARRLRCSPRTAQKHLEHLYRKLGVTDRLSAVLTAQQRGLLPGISAAGEQCAVVVRESAAAHPRF